ncbi:enoyl-CoA hydratase/isomerase family protein [Rhodococcus fascians]|nr:enoyl-CoA hydratase/isomerase family protein [Rhodococcus fascians]MBY3998459.1 enoyl-CoA hydratase/isomerase family protein [Rhodococcus fascians]MBY4004546.1 enoyl-CoA hydratase/isomerase family protein [Rhodococcus fascians]MBY4009272.1 enoyl-CoA hydratase/isomerase family protein [Rhodococcus fascians]MBY4019753.1 enoyl-CoA hydratase/isomerase family protein [Rhodococcus fascians]
MTAATTAETGYGRVQYRRHGDLAELRIDNPPVNASTAEVRSDMISGIERAVREQVTAMVLIGSDRAFVSGSDLSEFDSPTLPDPHLPTVIAAIENSPVPVVAALTGATLGGGLELALGCDARIAASSTVLGLPEVSLGMIPGAGGTQRLSRLVDVAHTIELVCTGRRLTAAEAWEAGIVDLVCPNETLLDTALAYARENAAKRVLVHEPVVPSAVGAIEAACADVFRRLGARPQVVAAVGVCLLAGKVEASTALSFERQEFHRLRTGTEARALRHFFFAERAAGREYRGGDASAIKWVGVIGAGTMGTGIVRALLDADFGVVWLDVDGTILAAGVSRLNAGLERAVANGRMADSVAARHMASLETTTAVAELVRCELVIEAVFEDFVVKETVLRQLDEVLRPDVPVATNTSYLNLDELAAVTAHPERVVGLHFFSPAQATRVLEVVRGAKTTSDIMKTAVAIARSMKKTPVVANVGFGFIGNRIFNAYRYQCELMLEEGALPHQIDRALESFGFAMGPFRVADLSGLDIAWRMRRSFDETRNPDQRYVQVADILCEQGRFGQKASRGWYCYGHESRSPVVDPAIEALIVAERIRKGISPRPFTDYQIVRRAVLAMVNEASFVLSENIAVRPSDVDVMLILGYGFPKYEGGPLFWAANQDREIVEAELDDMADKTGAGFRRADASWLFDDDAQKG